MEAEPGVSQQPTRLAYFQTLQAGRAIAALMVVVFHTCTMLVSPAEWSRSSLRYALCGRSGVEFFFVLSGIVILFAHAADLGQPGRLGPYLWKRFRRIYPIYWIVLTAAVLVYLCAPRLGKGDELQPLSVLGSYLLVSLGGSKILPIAWTLYQEILFYAVFAVAILHRRIGVAAIALWLLASAGTLYFDLSNAPRLVSPFPLLFGCGMIAAVASRRWSLPGWPLALAGLAGFLACALREDRVQEFSPVLSTLYGVCAATSAAGFIALERQGRVRVPAVLRFLGAASYSIYLIHFMALSAMLKLLSRLGGPHGVPRFALFAILFATAVSVGCVLHLAVERPLMSLLSRRPMQVKST